MNRIAIIKASLSSSFTFYSYLHIFYLNKVISLTKIYTYAYGKYNNVGASNEFDTRLRLRTQSCLRLMSQTVEHLAYISIVQCSM